MERTNRFKLITAIGAPRREGYDKSRYYYDGKTSGFYQIPITALVEFFRPTEVVVLCTKKASKSYEFLKEDLNQLPATIQSPHLKNVAISIPQNEEGINSVINAMIQNIKEDEVIHLDVTFGLRAIPFLSFLVSEFLSLKKASIEKLTYINFEAPGVDEKGEKLPPRIMDITEYLKIPRLLHAGRALDRSGDIKFLVEELKSAYPKALDDVAIQQAAEIQEIIQMVSIPRVLDHKRGQKLLSGVLSSFQDKNGLTPLIKPISGLVNNTLSPLMREEKKYTPTQMVNLVKWYY